MSNSNNDTIIALQAQVADLARQLANLQRDTTDDPQMEEPSAIKIFHPSDTERDRYPPIKPSDPNSFFTKEVPDDEFWDQLRRYPKNSAMGYEPPKIPSVMQLSSSSKNYDSQLRSVQKRLAHLTRPIDLFLHQVWSMEGSGSMDSDDVVELCSTFAIFIRDQLATTTGKINSMRLENLRTSQGVSFKQDSLDIVDPSKFQEEIKSTKALIKAFKPKQAKSSNHNNGRNYISYNYPNKGKDYKDTKSHNSNHDDDRSSFRKDYNSERRDNRGKRSSSQRRGRSRSRRPSRRESEDESLSS